ncbi:MAG: hypothetical protein DRP82_03795 [Planctomycetota bacterium]|nr:MAG: hypothetical protein DRP82_03795 [Planctomycetota bacterium]
MGLFGKLFGRKGGVERQQVSAEPVPPLTTAQPPESLLEVLTQERKQTIARLNEWMNNILSLVDSVKQHIETQQETLFALEAGVKQQLEGMKMVTQLMREQGERLQRVADGVEVLPELSRLPSISEEQKRLLEKVEVRLREQQTKSEALLSVFHDISQKLDALPAEERRRASILKELVSRLEAATKEEAAVRENIQAMRDLLSNVAENMRQQAKLIEAVEASQRIGLRELVDAVKRRSTTLMWIVGAGVVGALVAAVAAIIVAAT